MEPDDLAVAKRLFETGERRILTQVRQIVATIEANQQTFTDAELIKATRLLRGLKGALDAWSVACETLVLELYQGVSMP